MTVCVFPFLLLLTTADAGDGVVVVGDDDVSAAPACVSFFFLHPPSQLSTTNALRTDQSQTLSYSVVFTMLCLLHMSILCCRVSAENPHVRPNAAARREGTKKKNDQSDPVSSQGAEYLFSPAVFLWGGAVRCSARKVFFLLMISGFPRPFGGLCHFVAW